MAITVTSRYMACDPTTPYSVIEDSTAAIEISVVYSIVVAPIITLGAIVSNAVVPDAILTAIMTNTARVFIV